MNVLCNPLELQTIEVRFVTSATLIGFDHPNSTKKIKGGTDYVTGVIELSTHKGQKPVVWFIFFEERRRRYGLNLIKLNQLYESVDIELKINGRAYHEETLDGLLEKLGIQ